MNKGKLNKNLNNQQVLNLDTVNAVNANFSIATVKNILDAEHANFTEAAVQDRMVLPVVHTDAFNGTSIGETYFFINAANACFLIVWKGTSWVRIQLT